MNVAHPAGRGGEGLQPPVHQSDASQLSHRDRLHKVVICFVTLQWRGSMQRLEYFLLKSISMCLQTSAGIIC